MKKLYAIFMITALFLVLITSCKKSDGVLDQTSLRQTIDQSAVELNTAVASISATKAFSIFTMSNTGVAKSLNTENASYKVYIPLDLIKGVYDYKPVNKPDKWGWSLIKYFSKTAENSKMIVNMPLKKVQNPWLLRQYNASDSTLKNNFSIAVSDYHNNYNSYWDYDYVLASEVSIDNAVAGNLNIKSIVSPTNGITYASQYQFTGSYTAKYQYASGDTTVSSFDILSGTKVLYEEKLLTVRNDTARFGREHQYVLTIGNVQIIRKSGTKNVEIWVDGKLQPNATVAIVDKAKDDEASVCKKRDVQITFEDGTIKTISDLIGKSIDNINTLYTSLHEVFFAAYVVDWIAYDIYYQR